MNTNRNCGCKSFRTCKICEEKFNINPKADWGSQLKESGVEFYHLPVESSICYKDSNNDEFFHFPGIKIISDFITPEEEKILIDNLDLLPWDASQSGRRKQNFGPRANFKKQKIKNGSFKGFPKSTQFVQERFKTEPLLESYHTVEQCSIEYRPETGASIEPHIDDCWIWGERIVQLNLLSHSYLTCTPYSGNIEKYNLKDVEKYPKTVGDGVVIYNPFENKFTNQTYKFSKSGDKLNCAVKIPLPPRSLLIMFGSARYEWEHAILREDILSRRVVIAYRELTPSYLPGGSNHSVGQEILENGKLFW